MILDSTYYEKEHKHILNDVVGKPFSLFESIRMGGVGSKRMIIEEASPNLQQYLNKVSDINYANIELRTAGIIVFINKGLKNFTWAIPYYKLIIYRNKGVSIHAEGKFVRFRNNKTFVENKRFFQKLMNQKTKYNEQLI